MSALKLSSEFLNFTKKYNYNRINKQLPQIEKTIILNTIGNDPSIPKTIYNRVQKDLLKGKNVNVVLKKQTEDNSSYWAISNFKPIIYNNLKLQFSVSTEFATKKCIDCIQKLYNTLLDIEKNVNIEYANKFLDGYLEEKCIDFNGLVMLYN